MDLRELEKAQQDYKRVVSEMQMLKGEEIQLQNEKTLLITSINALGFDSVDAFLKKYSEIEFELSQLVSKISKDLGQ